MEGYLVWFLSEKLLIDHICPFLVHLTNAGVPSVRQTELGRYLIADTAGGPILLKLLRLVQPGIKHPRRIRSIQIDDCSEVIVKRDIWRLRSAHRQERARKLLRGGTARRLELDNYI